MKLLFAAVVICLASQANANPFSNEVDCEDALAPWSAYGSQSYSRGQDYCLQRYDQDRETERPVESVGRSGRRQLTQKGRRAGNPAAANPE